MGWSIPILHVAGIQLRIHITFLLLIAWIAFAYYTQGGSSAAMGGVLLILLLFACVVLHEFGHALAGNAFGINTPDLTLVGGRGVGPIPGGAGSGTDYCRSGSGRNCADRPRCIHRRWFMGLSANHANQH